MDSRIISTGSAVLARVAIMGAKRGCGWRYVWYTAKEGTKSGYVYARARTHGMYPNSANREFSQKLEKEYADKGIIVVHGRPVQNQNAPIVGGYRLHIEGDDSEPTDFRTMAEVRAEQRAIAKEFGLTVEQVEEMSYVVTEGLTTSPS